MGCLARFQLGHLVGSRTLLAGGDPHHFELPWVSSALGLCFVRGEDTIIMEAHEVHCGFSCM